MIMIKGPSDSCRKHRKKEKRQRKGKLKIRIRPNAAGLRHRSNYL